jgi:uncharacterized protein
MSCPPRDVDPPFERYGTCVRAGDVMGRAIEELVIIGAGPAGLAAANAAVRQNPLVVDAGPALHRRRHSSPDSLAQGVGGAGLFSDGKFSFWPSATALWKLEPRLLDAAYKWFHSQIAQFHVNVPPQPQEVAPIRWESASHEKRYPSAYVSFEDRHELISTLASTVSRLTTDIRVVNLSHTRGIWRLSFERGDSIYAHSVILTTGRYGPLLMLDALPPATLRFLRVEVGVRIEQNADEFFLAKHPQLDPKYVWRDASKAVEWKTFCCCRNGLVAWTAFQDIYSASGRADCPPTGRSNIGYNVRFLQPSAVADVLPHVLNTMRTLREPVTDQLRAFVEREARLRVGPVATALVRQPYFVI